jgi:hypothetical protein
MHLDAQMRVNVLYKIDVNQLENRVAKTISRIRRLHFTSFRNELLTVISNSLSIKDLYHQGFGQSL